MISSRAVFFDFEGGILISAVPEQYVMLASRRMPSLPFAQMTFGWSGRNGLGCVGKRRDWGAIALQMCMLNSPDFKTNTRVVLQRGFDTDLWEIILPICSLHNHIYKFLG